MPLRIVRAATNHDLWNACLEAWLGEVGSGPGPHPARLWLTHGILRDSALRAASAAGCTGWFQPPIHFLSELRELFDIRRRPIGVLTGRLLVARIARRTGRELGLVAETGDPAPARSHLLDSLIGELLAEGVEPDELEVHLRDLGGDEFAGVRNAWVTATYRAFHEELERRGLFDPRQIHALVARRVEDGALPDALRGAARLHVYGLTSLSHRTRMFRALATQEAVDVVVYQLEEPEPTEWDALVTGSGAPVSADSPETSGPARRPAQVRPAASALAEAALIVRDIKRSLMASDVRPGDVAIVVRTGRDDARLLHHQLKHAGVPSSARLRSRLSEVPALRAVLALFEAAGEGWTWRGLRDVATSPYFNFDLDARPLDEIASQRRVSGLEGWRAALQGLADALVAEPGHPQSRRLLRQGITAARVARTLEQLERITPGLTEFDASRSESDWVARTRRITRDGDLGFRRRVCDPAGGRYDLVRTDQRAVEALDSLLGEWENLVGTGAPVDPGSWHVRLRRLLEANELALTTPTSGGVHVLEAHEAALVPFPRVFLAHANDGEFPRPGLPGGVFTDSERSSLRRAGLPIGDRELNLRRERSLWRSVVAAEEVSISFRTATTTGIPLLPSLMIAESVAGETAPEAADTPPNEISIRRDEALMRDVRRLARRPSDGSAEPVVVSDPHMVLHAVVCAFAEQLRSGRLDGLPGIGTTLGMGPPTLLGRDTPESEQPHAWGGRVRDPWVLERLAERFGPEHAWSAGALQQYAIRPFDFFAARVLDIEIRAEAGEETTPLAAGSVAHAILERLYAPLLGGGAAPDVLRSRFDEVCDETFAAVEATETVWLGVPDLWRIRREELREALRAFVDWDAARMARGGIVPIELEFTFGSDAAPVDLSGPDLHRRDARLYVRGRIDRVEGPAPRSVDRVRLIDYKLGKPPPKKAYDDAAALQGAVYAAAWEALTGRVPAEAVYYSLAEPGTGSRSGLKGSQVEAVLAIVRAIPARVRAGLFEPVQATSLGAPAPWQLGVEVTRTAVRLGSGHRFEAPSAGSPDA